MLDRREQVVAKVSVILPAAGQSRRFGDKHTKKQFALLDGRPVWIHAAERFINREDVIQTLLIIAADDREYFQQKFASSAALLGIEVVIGGKERCDSVQNALTRVKEEAELICVHDAVRPCVAEQWIDRVFEKAAQTGAAILAIPITGTLKRVSADRLVEETVSRTQLWEAQTPQVFRRELLLKAYARRGDFLATDDAQLVERMGHPVHVVEGSVINVKIATKEDLRLAEQALKIMPKPPIRGPLHPFAGEDLWR